MAAAPPAPDATLTIKQLSNDGVELAAYLAKRFGKKKVILWGSSWGSVLGVHMAKARPELFHAYLGTSQLVSFREEDQKESYAQLLELAKSAGDSDSLAVLKDVGPPPHTDPRSFGKMRRIIRQYEAKMVVAAPEHWWKPAAEYATPKALVDYYAGEEFSFLAFVGLNGDGMLSRVDLPALGFEFDIPMFFVHGEKDLLTRPEVARRYYDGLKAPQKAFVVVGDAGHDPNQKIIDAQYKVLVERVMPLTKRRTL